MPGRTRREGGGGRDGGRRGDDDRGGHGRGGDRFERGAFDCSVVVLICSAVQCCALAIEGLCSDYRSALLHDCRSQPASAH